MVMICWVLAMIAAFTWSRWWTGLFALVTVLVAAGLDAERLIHWTGWARLLVLGGAPWGLALLRIRHEQLLNALHAEEATTMARIAEAARQLQGLQGETQQMERQIAEITEVYQVTKATAAALRVGELFTATVGIAPKLLNSRALRLIDCSSPTPQVWRAERSPDGRMAVQEGGALQDVERRVIEQLTAPAPGGGVAWAPLRRPLDVAEGAIPSEAEGRREQQPIGALVADELPEEQGKTLSMIADQLSLQLARIHLYQQVEALAVTDALTGLWVRRHFLGRAEEELARATRRGFSCAVLMVDLDHFKQKNDTYGHLVGDAVLKEVAGLLSRNLREVDLIGRFGGEEFVLLLVETTAEQVMPIAERLRQLVEVHPIQAYDERLSQTISIGVAGFPEDATTLDQLIERADQALYAAKRAGRNQVVRWTHD